MTNDYIQTTCNDISDKDSLECFAKTCSHRLCAYQLRSLSNRRLSRGTLNNVHRVRRLAETNKYQTYPTTVFCLMGENEGLLHSGRLN